MELQIFQNAEFGSVRSTMLKEEPYFVGKDVAEILGYADPNKAIAMHVDEDDKLNDKTASSLGQRGGWFINESGLYSLILSSKLPAAKRFKRWVTSEVLPAIRRHGLYAVDDMLNNPDALIEALQAYKAERMQRLALEAENAVQKQQLIEMQPKASYYDVVLNSPDLVSITEISKDYGWSTSTKTHTYPATDGSIHTKVHTYWTQKGRLFIYDLLKADGILPLIEIVSNDL